MQLRWIIIGLVVSVLSVLSGIYLLSANLDQYMQYSGLFYGALIILFLFGLMGAFIWSHVVYQEDIEKPKFSVLEIEKGELE